LQALTLSWLLARSAPIATDVGFNNAGVDADFFAGTQVKSNFCCNLGYGDESKIFDRLPRFAFESVCTLL